MATVESSDIEVIAEFGVPLKLVSNCDVGRTEGTYGASDGVTGSDGGCGMLINVGP